ncbi:MAG TPA: hypothetical protein PK605_03665 [Ignavibacteria bacterium]|nr:hypothetical protein [Bacteroidota bacterium]HRE09180.1 hypothetical protein [Ignavibacteria bacterium]HRF66142.1 hypothetical protein [Ignavibacteria bacterium]HRJ03482.1 hypothetical protein [Ignavibacteria bacterium]HRJ84066.1 hypothetical protein [Ignavibacteria bacterium]
MKTVSDDLFRLIKSLNKSEKGLFKKFASKNSSGSRQNYLLLFDAIDSLNEYDETLLRKKIKDPSLLKQLSVYKVYLFNLILKSLNQHASYENSETQLNELMANIRTLTSKHLYREAKKVIKKAKELAYKFDKHKFIMELLAAERHILILSPAKDITEKRISLFKEQQELVERINEFYSLSLLCDRMTILVDNEADFRSNENSKQMEEIISDPILTSPEKIEGYYALNNFYHTHLVYHGAKGNTAEIFKYLKLQIQHGESHKHFIDENPQNYVYALINLLLQAHFDKNQTETEDTLVKLESIKKRLKGKLPRETEIQILFHASNVEMIIHEKNCDMEAGRNKIKQIEADLKLYASEVPANTKSLMMLNLACFNIIDENYNASAKYLNILFNSPELNIRNDVNRVARILQLVLHYEMGNFDLIDYLLVSARKFLGAKQTKLENLMLKFFGNIIKLPKEKHAAPFDELSFAIKRIPDTNGMLTYFDLVSWAEACASGKKLLVILKEKNSNNS